MALKRVDVTILLSLTGADWGLSDLERAVDSIRRQEIVDWRLSVVDATCNLDAHALVKRMVPAAKLLWETPVLARAETMQACLWQAAGGMKSLWAAYIDAGCAWSKDHLLRLLSVGRSYELDFVFSGAQSPATEFWGRIPEALHRENIIDLASVLHTQGIYRAAVAGWRREQTTCADWDLWLQMAEAGAKFGHVAVPTVERRRSMMPVVDKREAQSLRSRFSVKPIPEFTLEDLKILAEEENESSEERLYLTQGNR